MGEADWDRLLYRLNNGDCTPFLGAGACAGGLPTGGELSRDLARRWSYPYPDDHDLPRVTQFAAMMFGDAVHMKTLVCNELANGRVPDFGDPLEPHSLLARFPLPVFLTTNYDDFIFRSLQQAGKHPNTAICPWHEGVAYAADLFGSEAGWNPQPETPLIYHLHGNLTEPTSLVVAEDDLEFLTNLAVDGVSGNNRMLPASILAALTKRPLLFIGYSLQDWTFRVLFRGLLKAVPGINRRRHVSVQLAPSLNSEADIQKVQHQLARYYEDWRISIFWGTAKEFCEELRRRMG